MTGLAELFAATHDVRVLVPTHPGFDVDYGRAYAAAIPMARFQLLPETGHSPQLETPDQVIHAIWDSADTGFSAFGR